MLLFIVKNTVTGTVMWTVNWKKKKNMRIF